MKRKENYIIDIKDLTHSYTHNGINTIVLNGVNLQIQHGEFVAIVGASGSGKSTLLNIIGLMEKPESGFVSIDDNIINEFNQAEFPALRNNLIGFIFQRYHLIPYLNVKDNIIVPSIYGGGNHKDAIKKCDEILDNLHIKHLKNNLPSQLSGGEQQRVSIGRALMNEPKIILADEPTGALDSKTAQSVMKIMHELNRAGHTIIMVTHDRGIASQAEKIVEISDGNIVGVSKNDSFFKNKSMHLKKDLKSSALMQTLSSAFSFSIKALYSHKFRSILSVLGIIIGICAVVTSIAIGEGSKKKVLDQISMLADDTFEVLPGESWKSVNRADRKSLKFSDVDLIQSYRGVEAVSPIITGSVSISKGSERVDVTLSGVGVDYSQIKEMKFNKGAFFSMSDLREKSQSIVIDEEVAGALFTENETVIGSTVKVNGIALRVIGVAKTGKMNKSQPDSWVPVTSMISRISGNNAISKIVLKSSHNINVLQADIAKMLITSHGKKDFHFMSNQYLTEAVGKTSDIMGRLIATIAAISLIVGGVGIMNIMLVSVTERTQEIGIRIAIGAKPRDILFQFLIESSMLCFFGGAIGVLISWLICFITPLMISDVTLIFDSTSAILSLISSAFTGVFFGFIPARNASRLQPRVALTRE